MHFVYGCVSDFVLPRHADEYFQDDDEDINKDAFLGKEPQHRTFENQFIPAVPVSSNSTSFDGKPFLQKLDSLEKILFAIAGIQLGIFIELLYDIGQRSIYGF